MPLSQYLADIVVLVHFLFIVFVLAGGMLLLRWPRLVWLHLPAIFWGVFIEVSGGICPLTPLENYLRAIDGNGEYQGGFIAHYLLPLIYPAGLTPTIQLLLAGVVIMFNLVIYTVVIRMRRKAMRTGRHPTR